MQFISITEPSEINELVSLSAKREISARWVTGLLASGESRWAWCRTARSETGQLLAAHAFDSFAIGGDHGAVPTFVHLLGHIDEAEAISLLAHDLRGFDARSVEARIVTDREASPDLRTLRESQPGVLEGAGFTLAVDRVRLSWPPESPRPRPRPTSRLTFTLARDVETDLLTRIFAEIGDRSLDHGMRSERRARGRTEEAALRLEQSQRRDGPDDWFVVGFDATGEPVGFVQAALSADEPILAEIGVVESQRGRGYVDDLLTYGTAVVLDTGRPAIVSDTDQENLSMRAAFARIGYVEFATRRDFRWQINERPANDAS